MPTKKKKLAKQWNTYEEYLQSEQWDTLRKATHERVINEFGELTCECCLADQRDDIKLKFEVHHWMYRSWDKDASDLHVLLCSDCHEKAHDHLPPCRRPPVEWSRVDWLLEFVRNHHAQHIADQLAYYTDQHAALTSALATEQAKAGEEWMAMALGCIQKLTGTKTPARALSELVGKWRTD